MRQFFKQEKGIYVIKNITLSNGKEIEKIEFMLLLQMNSLLKEEMNLKMF